MEGSAANTAGVFLLTPLREGRHTAAAPVNPTSCISTHAPAGGATRGTSCPCLSLCNFYSRPCGRGDLRDFPVFHVGIAISTHAPAGGATIGPHSFRKVYAVISTHAPAGGATPVSHTEGEAIALFLLTPLREGRLELDVLALCLVDFYSRPCGRGDFSQSPVGPPGVISTHAPAGGATKPYFLINLIFSLFLLTPLREGRPAAGRDRKKNGRDFYSRPCGRGDLARPDNTRRDLRFLLTPLREGRPITSASWSGRKLFLLTPLREGRRAAADAAVLPAAISTHAPAGGATKLPAAGSTSALNFYSRPCGRGDGAPLQASRPAGQFLLTPLREGRPDAALQTDREDWISTHAPAGGATDGKFHIPLTQQEFLLTPLREGRPRAGGRNDGNEDHFYSRPCGRGDFVGLQLVNVDHFISTHAPAGGATRDADKEIDQLVISTHAPAGGATPSR